MNIFSQLEALLFYFGEPISIKKISDILHITPEECEIHLTAWEEMLRGDVNRGIILLRKGSDVQLVTKQELRHIGEAIIKDEFREQLTPAALEALSLIAYLGPIPRSTVDYVRGVNSSFTIRALLMRGLIERVDEKGMAYHYRVTEEFLKHMGLTAITELPEYPKYKEILTQFEAQLHATHNPEQVVINTPPPEEPFVPVTPPPTSTPEQNEPTPPAPTIL